MDCRVCLKKIPRVRQLSQIAVKNNTGVWLVGGCLRDIYLKVDKRLTDFDFCVEKNTSGIARRFAEKIHAKYIVLDSKNQSFRVILKKQLAIYTYDFTLMRGRNLAEDLSLRDFSVNSLAVDLRLRNPQVIDLYKGKEDLNRKILRVIRGESIVHDPLRILRGFSLSAAYRMRIQPRTLRLMEEHKELLGNVAGERITEELYKILSCGRSFAIIRSMDKLKIIDVMIPEVKSARGVSQGSYHHLDVWNHSLETLRQFELLSGRYRKKNSEVSAYLDTEIIPGRRRAQILKLACILHDIGKPSAKRRQKGRSIFYTHEKIGRDLSAKISRRLRFSSKEREMLGKLVFWHLRPGYLSGQTPLTRRAVYRFFRDTRSEAVSVVLLSLADLQATRGPLITPADRRRYKKTMAGLIDLYFSEQRRAPVKRIIDGHWVMKRFKLKSGPLVGEILSKVEEERSLGNIQNKREAYSLVRRLIK